MRTQTIIATASLLLMIGVATGAFGSHGLRAYVEPDRLAVWNTAVLYQFVHALGMLGVAALRPRLHSRLSSFAAVSMLAGILIFSGSLYALVLSGVGVLGAITPIGGVAFMVGWISLAGAAVRTEGRDVA